MSDVGFFSEGSLFEQRPFLDHHSVGGCTCPPLRRGPAKGRSFSIFFAAFRLPQRETAESAAAKCDSVMSCKGLVLSTCVRRLCSISYSHNNTGYDSESNEQAILFPGLPAKFQEKWKSGEWNYIMSCEDKNWKNVVALSLIFVSLINRRMKKKQK